VSAALLSVHVLAVVLTIGPVTVAASMFPRFARQAAAEQAVAGGSAPRTVLMVLNRICRVYAAVALFVPVFGLATAASLGVLTDPWIIISVGLTVIAALLLTTRILPAQRHFLEVSTGHESTGDSSSADALAARLGATTGMFGLLWVAVTVLMILRPGSTTGV